MEVNGYQQLWFGFFKISSIVQQLTESHTVWEQLEGEKLQIYFFCVNCPFNAPVIHSLLWLTVTFPNIFPIVK